MIIANHKPICIIGYPESSMTMEFDNHISTTYRTKVMFPAQFNDLANPDQYQYIVSMTWDLEERQQVINRIDELGLDLITVIHDTCILGSNPAPQIQPGTFVFPYACISLGAVIARHCIIGPYSMIGHFSVLGNNCILRPGVMITDKSKVGNNCVFNIRSTVTNKSLVADNVELKAFSGVTKDIVKSGTYIGTPARPVFTAI